HGLGAGAGKGGPDVDGRKIDLRQRRNRQQTVGEEAREHDRDRHEAARDRPADERAGEIHREAGTAAPADEAAAARCVRALRVRRSKNRYTTGVVKRVSTWLTSKPPTITRPSGWRSSAPEPEANISGSAPKSAASVVIRIGRKRSIAAWWMAARGDSRCRRSASSAKSIIMIPFFFTRPIRR